MAQLNIHREHRLGLKAARKIAWQWAEQVEAEFGMSCTVIEGEDSDVVEFSRSGVDGRLTVAADHFDLQAKLGFLLGAFSRTIEAEIEKNLDALLGAAGGEPAAKAAKKATASAADKPAGKAAKPAAAKPAATAAGAPAKAARKR